MCQYSPLILVFLVNIHPCANAVQKQPSSLIRSEKNQTSFVKPFSNRKRSTPFSPLNVRLPTAQIQSQPRPSLRFPSYNPLGRQQVSHCLTEPSFPSERKHSVCRCKRQTMPPFPSDAILNHLQVMHSLFQNPLVPILCKIGIAFRLSFQ